MNWELPAVQAGFRKDRGTRDQIANIRWITEKARQFQRNIYFSFTAYAKPLTVWITTNCRKFFEMRIPDHLTCLLQNLYAGQEATFKQTGSKLGKGYIKAVYCHPAYSTCMQSTSCEILGWMKNKLDEAQAGWSTSWNQDHQEKYQ